ncbi:MAG TPA: hypothetical protein V6C91_22775 [Coleofasciculaceae cyanobacterium]
MATAIAGEEWESEEVSHLEPHYASVFTPVARDTDYSFREGRSLNWGKALN